MPVEKSDRNVNKNSKFRKQGETMRRVAIALIASPDLCIPELAKQLGKSPASIYDAIRKLKKDPYKRATRLGISAKQLVEAFVLREKAAIEKKAAQKAAREAAKKKARENARRKRECKKLEKQLIYQAALAKRPRGQMPPPWKRSGNENRKFVAKRFSMSKERLAQYCHQSYCERNGRYVFDEARAGKRPADLPKYYPVQA